MTAPTVLLTGPIGNETRWLAAAREAGWNAVSFPLLEIHDLDANLVDRVDGLPDWIAVTSSNALGALERAGQNQDGPVEPSRQRRRQRRS